MKKLLLATRFSFGALFLVFGMNGFLNFMPMPTPTPAAGEFLGALFKTGFIFPVIKAIEVLVGLSMITNRFTSLSLVVITPILTVITLHNFILDPNGIALNTFILMMYGLLLFEHRNNYSQLISAEAIV